jgi:hypothetical protein
MPALARFIHSFTACGDVTLPGNYSRLGSGLIKMHLAFERKRKSSILVYAV